LPTSQKPNLNPSAKQQPNTQKQKKYPSIDFFSPQTIGRTKIIGTFDPQTNNNNE
jgi:hypothetical protein